MFTWLIEYLHPKKGHPAAEGDRLASIKSPSAWPCR